ncbi:MAG: M55 family metallopeptidase [Clostridia bacterium]|nr:M55 family metallopeptidase [Clostridia bacterium]
MKVYFSCDIEGSAGVAHRDECTHNHPDYEYFRNQMTKEVAGACEGANMAGAKELLVRDAHGTARNIIPSALPENASIVRGGGGDMFAMVTGINTSFDAAVMTGFHSGVGTDGCPLSHTFNKKTEMLMLNDMVLSEFLFNTYSAAYHGVPVVFVSGDEAICEFAKELVSGITTVATQKGIGSATKSIHPDLAVKKIKEGVQQALSGDLDKCKITLPEKFVMKVRFRNHADAYFNSFYTGIKQLDAKTLQYETDDWLEILRMVHFVLDK